MTYLAIEAYYQGWNKVVEGYLKFKHIMIGPEVENFWVFYRFRWSLPLCVTKNTKRAEHSEICKQYLSIVN